MLGTITLSGGVCRRTTGAYTDRFGGKAAIAYRDGTTYVIFEPLDFIARLAALMPKPRLNLTRFHGVFAPNSKHRARVTPAKRGRGGQHPTTGDPQEPTPAERRAAMTWAQRLKRVFGIDIETCPAWLLPGPGNLTAATIRER